MRGQRNRIGLNAYGRFLTATDADQTDTAQLRQLRREPRVDEISTCESGIDRRVIPTSESSVGGFGLL